MFTIACCLVAGLGLRLGLVYGCLIKSHQIISSISGNRPTEKEKQTETHKNTETQAEHKGT